MYFHRRAQSVKYIFDNCQFLENLFQRKAVQILLSSEYVILSSNIYKKM